ncbi:substrate-binding domain-containing protein [Aeromicrobium sp.]|uniref:substrate-binding domain-containing protein n=1 Tax=Aeromicrobium sp. TaxID=1871063 RepID=UPI0025B84257|nr:substrate-binding domain-containing protein [Aeromicrobium sp.]MCK5892625.1 substrate-binding domain-containing protein [Aeromicrobium sp.]
MSRPRLVSRHAMTAAAVLLSLSTLAACGSDDGGSGSGSGSGEVPAEVTQLVEDNLANPTSLGYDTPLSKPVPSDIKIVALQVPVDVAKVEGEAMRKAAESLGWSYETVVVGDGPEAPAKAFDQAIDKKPDGIYYSGYTTQSISQQLERAASEGIAVFSEALGADTPEQAFAQIRNTPAVKRLAELNAAWIVADSGGAADVLIVDTPAFPILHEYSEQVKTSIEGWCSGCSVTITDANVTDIGTKLPAQIVSELQRSPQTNYLVFSFGDLTIGLNPALAAAGLQGKVKVTGQLPGLDNLKSLETGENAMWVPELSPLIGWRVIDAFARHFVGDDPEVAADGSPTPTQLLTPENVGSAVYDPSGYWVGVDGYEGAFKKLWNVG